MTTKLDQNWAGDLLRRSNSISIDITALVLEVERLEGILERIENLIDPNPSPGGDTEWLVKNYFDNCAEIARQRGQLETELERLKKECEVERMRLAACGVAAMANTEETQAKQRIGRDNPYWSASYGDVCDAVDREMKLRDRVSELVEEIEARSHWEDSKSEENHVLKARISTLESALKVKDEALEFYARVGVPRGCTPVGDVPLHLDPYWQDQGKRAREALSPATQPPQALAEDSKEGLRDAGKDTRTAALEARNAELERRAEDHHRAHCEACDRIFAQSDRIQELESTLKTYVATVDAAKLLRKHGPVPAVWAQFLDALSALEKGEGHGQT